MNKTIEIQWNMSFIFTADFYAYLALVFCFFFFSLNDLVWCLFSEKHVEEDLESVGEPQQSWRVAAQGTGFSHSASGDSS